MYRKNTASQFFCFQGVDATTGGIKSGATYTVRRCLDGTFAAAGGTVTEDSTNGWYKFAMTQADTNGNNVAFNFTASGAVPQTIDFVTTAADPTDAVHFGLSALPNTACTTNASLLTSGTGTDQLSVTSGRIDVGKLLGTAWLAPGTAGTPDVNAKLIGGTAQTGRDIGASVLLASGQKVDVDTIKTNPVVNAGTVTFPTGATLASTTNITAGTITTATNLTNAPTAGDLTATMKTSVTTACSASTPVATVSGDLSATMKTSVTTACTASTPTAAAVTGAVGSVTGLTASNLDATISSRLASATYVSPTTALTESYSALHAAPTEAQLLFEIRSLLAEKSVASTTLTTHKVDGSSSAMTFTLNDATLPTSITRAS